MVSSALPILTTSRAQLRASKKSLSVAIFIDCAAYRERFDLEFTALALSHVYGPRQRPDMAFSKLFRAALTGEKFMLYGDGRQVRERQRQPGGQHGAEGSSEPRLEHAGIAVSAHEAHELDHLHQRSRSGFGHAETIEHLARLEPPITLHGLLRDRQHGSRFLRIRAPLSEAGESERE